MANHRHWLVIPKHRDYLRYTTFIFHSGYRAGEQSNYQYIRITSTFVEHMLLYMMNYKTHQYHFKLGTL